MTGALEWTGVRTSRVSYAAGGMKAEVARDAASAAVTTTADTLKTTLDQMAVVEELRLSDEVTYADIFGALEPASANLGRKVNPTVYSPREFERRTREHNSFVTRVLKLPKLWLVGSEDDIAA